MSGRVVLDAPVRRPSYWWALWQTLADGTPVDRRLLGLRGRLALRELRRRGLVRVDLGWVRKT